MTVSPQESERPCKNCRRTFPESQLDPRFWCHDCRRVVIRRATWIARAVGLLVALPLAVWTVAAAGASHRFFILFVVLIMAAYFITYKVVQRVAFEAIRSRGVPPPKVEPHG